MNAYLVKYFQTYQSFSGVQVDVSREIVTTLVVGALMTAGDKGKPLFSQVYVDGISRPRGSMVDPTQVPKYVPSDWPKPLLAFLRKQTLGSLLYLNELEYAMAQKKIQAASAVPKKGRKPAPPRKEQIPKLLALNVQLDSIHQSLNAPATAASGSGSGSADHPTRLTVLSRLDYVATMKDGYVLIVGSPVGGGTNRISTNFFAGSFLSFGGGIIIPYYLLDLQTGEVVAAGAESRFKGYYQLRTKHIEVNDTLEP